MLALPCGVARVFTVHFRHGRCTWPSPRGGHRPRECLVWYPQHTSLFRPRVPISCTYLNTAYGYLHSFARPVYLSRSPGTIIQEEVGELKAELRKAVAEAKTVERRMSVGVGGAGRRNGGGGGVFGFKAKGGEAHTPSKKLSEAKNR